MHGDLNGRKHLGFLTLLTEGTRFDSDLCLSNLIPKCSLVENNPELRGKKCSQEVNKRKIIATTKGNNKSLMK